MSKSTNAQGLTLDVDPYLVVVCCDRCKWRADRGTKAAALVAAARHLKRSHGDLHAARRVRELVARAQ